MFRTSDIVLIGVMVAAAAMTYTIKRDAGEQLATVRKLQVQIRTEEETIDLLKADWSLLTQPARLQRLAEVYHSELQLAPVEVYQIADIDELPVRPVEIEDFSNERLGGMADSGIEAIITGGVVQ